MKNTSKQVLVSDTASKDSSLDKSGPTLKEILSKQNDYSIEKQWIVPDDIHDIQKTIELWADKDQLNLILLTGGTGFSERDRTPEVKKKSYIIYWVVYIETILGSETTLEP